MGVFDDKKFEELDWISQATEPMDSQLNDVLAALPDQVEITFDLFCKFLESSCSLNLTVDRVVNILAHEAKIYMSYSNRSAITNLFNFEI